MLHIFPLKAYPVSVRWFCGLAETQLRTLYRRYIRNNDHFSGLVQAYLRFVSSSHVILFTVFPHDKRVVYGTHATKNTDTVPIHPCIGRMYNLYRLAKQSRPAHWLAWYSSPTCSQARAGSTGKDLDPGQIGVGIEEQTGRPQINFAMKGDAVRRFGDFTRQNIGNILTVTLDREVIESATINSAITGQGVITGQFTNAEAQRIATVLRYGALPVALSIASQQTIGPTLGQDSIVKSQIAGAIGIGLVLLFMLLYYRLPGLLADLALLLYTAMTFAIFKLIGVTLTLAGIAGFVLSIGMAVDANVLTFERVKEELRAGRLLASAIDLGWKRAWPSIRDSNITTMITCAVLYVFGNNFGASNRPARSSS